MIPKPNKDHKLAKGWRPIVLANTCGKLVEKCVARWLQRLTPLFDPLKYGSSVGSSAIYALMHMVSKIETAMAKGYHVTLLRKDIVSACNQVNREQVCQLIQAEGKRELEEFVRDFLASRHFNMVWDGVRRGTTFMTQSALQGLPLSPVHWLIFIAEMLKSADTGIAQRQAETPHSHDTRHRRPPSQEESEVTLTSYVDDVNTLVITCGTRKTHLRTTQRLQKAIEAAATR